MLRPEMVEKLIDHVHRLWPPEGRPSITLCSNGTLLEPEMVNWLAQNEVLLQLSSDGVESAQQQRGQGTFGTLDGVFRMMMREVPEYLGRQMTIKLTLTAANLPYLADSIGYLIDRGVGAIDVVPLNTHDPEWVEGTYWLLEEQMVAVRKFCSKHFLRTGTVPCSMFRLRDPEQQRKGGSDRMCGFGQGAQLVVDVDGSLVACAALVPSFQSIRGELHGQLLARARIGEVGDFDESMRGALHRRGQGDSPVFRQKDHKWSKTGGCRDCQYLTQCFVCPVSIAHIPGNTDPHRIPANQCDFNLAVGRQRELFRRDVEAAR
jgi:sulfatase maturation enzyme AslB (radical SAM superfamily)